MKQFYKHLLLTIFSLSITSMTYSQNCNIGNETITGDFATGSFNPNFILGAKYTLSQEGTLNSINLIGNGVGQAVQMAVYDDNAGIPNNLIASSNLSTFGSGITSLPVTSTVLPSGDYWIMAVYEVITQSSVNFIATGNTVYYQSLTYGTTIPTNASGFLSYSGHDFLYFLEIDCGNTLSIEPYDLANQISLYPTYLQFYSSFGLNRNRELHYL